MPSAWALYFPHSKQCFFYDAHIAVLPLGPAIVKVLSLSAPLRG